MLNANCQILVMIDGNLLSQLHALFKERSYQADKLMSITNTTVLTEFIRVGIMPHSWRPVALSIKIQ